MPYWRGPGRVPVTVPEAVPVDLSPWRAGRVVCIDGRAWLEIAQCEFTDRICLPSTETSPARLDTPQVTVVMNRMRWVTATDAPVLSLSVPEVMTPGFVTHPLVVAGQAWHVLERDWRCATPAAHPKTDVVDTLVQLKLSLIRAWWADPPPAETTMI